MRNARLLAVAAGVAVVLAATGCTAGVPAASTTSEPTGAPTLAPSATRSPGSSPNADASAPAAPPLAGGLAGPQRVTEDPASVTTLARDLDAPWSIVRLTDGSILVDERDTGVVKEILADGSAGAIGTVPGVAAAGEGGLLGMAAWVEPSSEGATSPTGAAGGSGSGSGGGGQTFLYAYETTATDNRVIRMPLSGTPGGYSLGAASDVLTGIPKSSNHNGGRIAFGPDGMLYITAGDASRSSNAQDVDSLSGKILRVTPTGEVPADNPFAGSPVYSLGHRNPQGMTWGADGTMYAAEFGQDTWDEINIIRAGANYGWPTIEGISSASGTTYANPIYQWATDDASPSGMVMLGDTIFLAGLGGERLWSITVRGPIDGTNQAVSVASQFDSSFGRLRDVAAGARNTLLMLTNNTDGRGSPSAGDDRLLSVPLQSMRA